MYSFVLDIHSLVSLIFQGKLQGTLDDVFGFEDVFYAASIHSSGLADRGIHPQAPGLYFISSPVSDKIYAGSTGNLSRRKSQHYHDLGKFHENPNLQELSQKHGRDEFRFTSLELYADRETLYRVEQALYDKLHECAMILNTGMDIKAAWKGRQLTKETRLKLALAKTGQPAHESQLKAMEKLWEDDEFRQRKSESAKKKWEDPTYRQKMLEANLGSVHTQEHKDKIAASLKGGTKSNSRKVSVLGVEYPTVNHAVEATKIPGGTLRRWLNSNKEKHKDYFFV